MQRRGSINVLQRATTVAGLCLCGVFPFGRWTVGMNGTLLTSFWYSSSGDIMSWHSWITCSHFWFFRSFANQEALGRVARARSSFPSGTAPLVVGHPLGFLIFGALFSKTTSTWLLRADATLAPALLLSAAANTRRRFFAAEFLTRHAGKVTPFPGEGNVLWFFKGDETLEAGDSASCARGVRRRAFF